MSLSFVGAAPGSTGRAVTCAACAILLFASMNAAVKWLAQHGYPLSQIIFCRSFFALAAVFPLVLGNGGIASLRTKRPLGHVGRSLIGLLSMALGFSAIALQPLANVVALAFTAPLFTTLLGVLLLGERIRWRRTVALLVGFAGVLVMAKPDFGVGGGVLSLGPALSLGGAACAALAMITIRRLSATEPSTTIVFYFMAAAAIGSGIALPFQFVMPDAMGALILVAIGLIGGVAQVLLTSAYRMAPVAVVAPMDYTAMLWATIYGFAIWGETPDLAVIAGALIVVASGAYILFREIKLGVAATAPPKLRPNLT